MVAAAATVNRKRNTIHLVTEADITRPRSLIAAHRERTGERLSLTAYVVTCLGRTLSEFAEFNSFRKGGRLIVLDEITVGVLMERELDGEKVPEPVSIHAIEQKTFREVNDELRAAQRRAGAHLGSLSGTAWIRFIPAFLLRAFVRIASRNVAMQKRFGVVAVSAIGMFGSGALWAVPLTSATVNVAVGTVVSRPTLIAGALEEREHLCMTVSFNHDIVDGAPAARFTSRFTALLASGEELGDAASGNAGGSADGTRPVE
jgi:pyruvate/2-oxoglutarate dehydrogenase complex dihydrolipoamide acyltransferase (E2) component